MTSNDRPARTAGRPARRGRNRWPIASGGPALPAEAIDSRHYRSSSGKLSELIGRDASVQVVLALVVQQVLEPDPPVPSDPTEGDLSGLKQADQVPNRRLAVRLTLTQGQAA